MLTGKRAFSGPTTTDVTAAILHTTPDWSALPASTPPTIVRLVRRCLERDPKARLHDIGDARLEIEDVEKAREAELVIAGGVPNRRASRPNASRRLLAGAGLLLLGAVATAAYVLIARYGAVPAQEVRLQLPPPQGTRFFSVPAVSPDGRQIAFVTVPDAGGISQLWIRPLSADAPTPLAGTEGVIYPFWSPDGRSLGFFADGKLKRVSVASGGPIELCDAAAGRGGLWLDDDTIAFAPSQSSPLMRVSAAGGAVSQLTTLAEDETGHRFPQQLPHGQMLYFAVNRTPDKSGTRLVSIDAPERAINFFPGVGVAQYVNGFLVFVRQASPSNLLAQQITLPGGQPRGDVIDLGRVRVSEVFGRYMVATAPSGVITYMGPIAAMGQFTWVSRDGRVLETVGDPDIQLGAELSPDGQRVATLRGEAIWTLELARPVLNRVTQSAIRHPIWSPDGTRMASVNLGRGIGIFSLQVISTATGDATTLFDSSANVKPLDWTRDGQTLVFNQTVDKSNARGIWMMPVNQPQRATLYLQDGAQHLEGRLSPDDKWLAYSTDRSGRFEVEVQSFPVPGARHAVSFGGGGYPRWRADGRGLYHLSANSRLMAVAVTPGTPPVFGKPEPLFEADLVAHPDRGNFAAYEYDVSADGSRFLVNRQVAEPVTSLTIILNWNPLR